MWLIYSITQYNIKLKSLIDTKFHIINYSFCRIFKNVTPLKHCFKESPQILISWAIFTHMFYENIKIEVVVIFIIKAMYVLWVEDSLKHTCAMQLFIKLFMLQKTTRFMHPSFAIYNLYIFVTIYKSLYISNDFLKIFRV